jgi:hypothetical protein
MPLWKDELCPVCGLKYKDFRTNLNYMDIYGYLWSDDPDSDTWNYKGRHTVLGFWHQTKRDLWERHIEEHELEKEHGDVEFYYPEEEEEFLDEY